MPIADAQVDAHRSSNQCPRVWGQEYVETRSATESGIREFNKQTLRQRLGDDVLTIEIFIQDKRNKKFEVPRVC